LNKVLSEKAEFLGIPMHEGRIHSSDVFYRENPDFRTLFEEHGCIGVEMESFALFNNAKVLGKQASCLLTVSDSLVTHEVTTAEERQTAFTNMMKVALELAE
ncbi:MAG TPA: purine nucleoside phosphorylase DeoD-type, partial [Bacillota bacterium]|nr:purine nucleoside phosphorylase DeoD-type [Bacillota bacterium]